MSDEHDKHAKLLADTFHENWNAGPAATFARAAAAHARRRRRTRASLAVAGAAAAVAAGLFFSLRIQPTPEAAHLAPPPLLATNHGYEIISDDELLKLLRDRPILILEKGGDTREIVLLANR